MSVRRRVIPSCAAALWIAGAALGAQETPTIRATEVDSVRLLRDLSALAHDSMEGRAPGTAGSLRARAYISDQLARGGARPLNGEYAHPFSRGGRDGVNLLAVIPGRLYPDRYIVVTAHYDHLGVRAGEIYNGADDNASGVATLLAVSRAFSADPLGHSLLIAAVDDEEAGMVGSAALVEEPPIAMEQIALNVNLDMVSRTDGTLWAGGAYHTPSLRPVLDAVASEAPLTLRLGHDSPDAPEGDDWTGASDHAPFHRAGIPFVYFGVEDHADYHRPTDDFEAIDPAEFVAAARTVFLALSALDQALGPGADTGRRVALRSSSANIASLDTPTRARPWHPPKTSP